MLVASLIALAIAAPALARPRDTIEGIAGPIYQMHLNRLWDANRCDAGVIERHPLKKASTSSTAPPSI